MYKLESDDVTMATGPGGGWSTPNWVKFFKTLKAAKAYAEKDYGNLIDFRKREDNGKWCSGDLLYVMYNIEKVNCEED